MSFNTDWLLLPEEYGAPSADTALIAPLVNKRFEITESREHRIIIRFATSGQTQPLQRGQFEMFVGRIDSFGGVSDLQRLPPDAEPYAVMLSLHPRYGCDERDGMTTKTNDSTRSQLTEHNPTSSTDVQEHVESDLNIYADMLFSTDALECHGSTVPSESETPAFINLYTLLSDAQRGAGDLRQAVREVLLDRLHCGQPVHGQCGSVQRTSRRNRMLRADEEVIALPEDTGIPRERTLAIDRKKVDDTLKVTDPSEADVYEIEESGHVWKADVDKERKETRL